MSYDCHKLKKQYEVKCYYFHIKTKVSMIFSSVEKIILKLFLEQYKYYVDIFKLYIKSNKIKMKNYFKALPKNFL